MKIAVLAGDEVGPGSHAGSGQVLKGSVTGNQTAVELVEAPIGQADVDAAGDPLPAKTLEIAHQGRGDPVRRGRHPRRRSH